MTTVASMTFSGGGIRDADIAAAAAIAATKVEHQFSIDIELAEQDTTVADIEKLAHIVRGGSAELVAFEAAIITAGAGAADTIEVDLQKGNAGNDFATLCSTVIEIDGTTAVRTPVAAVLSTTALSDGDILKVVVDQTTDTTQAKGLVCTITLREDPT